jgi:hypothetical protein
MSGLKSAAETLELIRETLDGVEWDAGTIETVAELLRDSGAMIRPPLDEYRVTFTVSVVVRESSVAGAEKRAQNLAGKTRLDDWRISTVNLTDDTPRFHDCPNCGGHAVDEAY